MSNCTSILVQLRVKFKQLYNWKNRPKTYSAPCQRNRSSTLIFRIVFIYFSRMYSTVRPYCPTLYWNWKLNRYTTVFSKSKAQFILPRGMQHGARSTQHGARSTDHFKLFQFILPRREAYKYVSYRTIPAG